jgi:hypothetical protein
MTMKNDDEIINNTYIILIVTMISMYDNNKCVVRRIVTISKRIRTAIIVSSS